MASRKMTFTFPEELASRFVRLVAPRDRSKFLADALTDRLEERERALIHSCEVANQDAEVGAIERELDSLPDEIMEPWTDGDARER
jgi:hypothetical protein